MCIWLVHVNVRTFQLKTHALIHVHMRASVPHLTVRFTSTLWIPAISIDFCRQKSIILHPIIIPVREHLYIQLIIQISLICFETINSIHVDICCEIVSLNQAWFCEISFSFLFHNPCSHVYRCWTGSLCTRIKPSLFPSSHQSTTLWISLANWLVKYSALQTLDRYEINIILRYLCSCLEILFNADHIYWSNESLVWQEDVSWGGQLSTMGESAG